jgi:hypothetical protein
MAFRAQPSYAVCLRGAGLEVPVTTDPDEAAGRGHLRAAHADREHVIEALKAAFVQGRLDTGELDDRVGRAFTSRTYAELAALTADIPASRPGSGPPDAGRAGAREVGAGPSSTPARTLAKAARRAGLCLLAAFALVGVMALANTEFSAAVAFYCGIAAVIAASGFLGYGVVDAWHEWRSRVPTSAPGAPRTGSHTRLI